MHGLLHRLKQIAQDSGVTVYSFPPPTSIAEKLTPSLHSPEQHRAKLLPCAKGVGYSWPFHPCNKRYAGQMKGYVNRTTTIHMLSGHLGSQAAFLTMHGYGLTRTPDNQRNCRSGGNSYRLGDQWISISSASV